MLDRETSPRLPPWALRGIAVAILCATAKALLVILRFVDGAGHTLVSPWTPVAFFYQDLMVALGWCVVELGWSTAVRRRPRATRWLDRGAIAAYAGFAGYIGLNIPV